MITKFCGDAVAVMRQEIPDESVHLVCTSPPYDRQREGAYDVMTWKQFTAIAQEIYRVLVPGGVVCWNVNDGVVKGSETLTSFRQAIHFVDMVGFRMHDTMIYEKVNFSHPERSRYHSVFEYIFVLSKGAPRVFNPIKDKKNIYGGQIGGFGINTYTEKDGSKSLRNVQHNVVNEFGMRTNVWRGNTRGQEDPCANLTHPAMMPKWLARDLILSWSNAGDTVLDPMAGSGTTPQQALLTGRKAIAIDVNPDYMPLIEQSTQQSGLKL